MEIGISTSCLYPMETERAAELLGQMDVKAAEVFLNTVSEMTPDFIDILKYNAQANGMRFTSVHPCTSFAEPYFLFGDYERRFWDAMKFYERYFEVAKLLGAKILVIHGDWKNGVLKEKEYFRRYEMLMKAGQKHGVWVAQENVNRYRSEDPYFLLRMKEAIGKDFRMVFDIKQSVRAGYDPFLFLELLGENIAHVHISDHMHGADCLPPGAGMFDFPLFFRKMKDFNYQGDYIIELYRKNYQDTGDLLKAKMYLNQVLLNENIR